MNKVRDFIIRLWQGALDSLSGEVVKFSFSMELPAKITVGILIIAGLYLGLDQCSGELRIESPYQTSKE